MTHKIPRGTGNDGGSIHCLWDQTFDFKVCEVVL